MRYNNPTMKKIFITGLFMLLAFMPLEFAMAETPKAAIDLYNAGIDYYNAGDSVKSIDSFKKAISIDPSFYEAYYNLVQIQTAEGKLDDAIQTYTKILELKPNDEECAFEFANVLYKRGYLKKALTYLDRIPPDSDYYNRSQRMIDKITTRLKELETAQKAAAEKALAEKKAQEQKAALEKLDSGLGKSTIYSGIPNPSGVAADSLGNIYIASYSENVIYKINRDNQKSTFVGSSVLDGPIGLAVDMDNNLYVANYNKNNILKVTPNGAPTVFLTVKKPYCLNISSKMLFVTEQSTDTTIKFPL